MRGNGQRAKGEACMRERSRQWQAFFRSVWRGRHTRRIQSTSFRRTTVRHYAAPSAMRYELFADAAAIDARHHRCCLIDAASRRRPC